MSIALSGGILTWGDFPGETRGQFCEGLAYFLARAGWEIEARVAASKSFTYSSQPTNGQTLTVGSRTYTWRNTIDNSLRGDVSRGASKSAALNNMVAAINNGSGQGTIYSNPTFRHPLVSASTDGNTLTFTFKHGGTAGNGYPSTFGKLVGGGYQMLAHSPQIAIGGTDFMRLRAFIFDNQDLSFSTPIAKVKFQGYVYPDNEYTAAVEVGTGLRYRVVANRCQFFVYREGEVGDAVGSIICGGILHAVEHDICVGVNNAANVDELWWMSADNGLQPGLTPRTCVLGNGQIATVAGEEQHIELPGEAEDWDGSAGAWNSALIEPGFGYPSPFRIVNYSPSPNWSAGLGNPEKLISSILWVSDVPLELEPFVAWPDNLGGTRQIRGQMYDSMLWTGQMPMDRVIQYDGEKWLAFTRDFKFGSLMLLVPDLEPTRIEDALQAHYSF